MTTQTVATPITATFDIAPTDIDIAAARELWASVVAETMPGAVVAFDRYYRASKVAAELRVALQRLRATDEPSARFAARALALYEEWMRP
jgi:hypothetical protein